ncbi:MAG: putative glycolipid-binding domain-containing protein, partial [Anaerolineales bacterium]|nr:putative glycolipid-binding domain-containing protein [Anaerolineales bacterium]
LDNQKDIQRYLMWQQIDGAGSEYCSLQYKKRDWYLNGTIITTFNDQPTLVKYQIRCDEMWCTRHVQVTTQSGQDQQNLELIRDEQYRWHINGQVKDSLGQCVDVDLGVTPATNTLPIRRLSLAVGETAEVFAAWVRFPQLSVEVLGQRYTRLSETRYKYESRGGAFVTEFEVDRWGIVLTYPDLWERIGSI